MQILKVGTLIEDNGKIGIIARVIRMGKMDFESHILSWQDNYEIHYLDGNVTVIGVKAFARLVEDNKIKIIASSGTTTLLPPSYPTTGGYGQ
jgi:MOSC domain-containing protein YiiM